MRIEKKVVYSYDEDYIASWVSYVWNGNWCDNILNVYENYVKDYELFKKEILRVYEEITSFMNTPHMTVIEEDIFTDDDYKDIYIALKKYVNKEKEKLKKQKRNKIQRCIEDIKSSANEINYTVKIYDRNGKEV